MRTVIVAIAIVNGVSVFAFWSDQGSLTGRLLGGAAAAVASYLGARVIAS